MYSINCVVRRVIATAERPSNGGDDGRVITAGSRRTDWMECGHFVYGQLCLLHCCCWALDPQTKALSRSTWLKEWKWRYNAYVSPALCRLLSVFCWAMSIAVLWSEVSVLFPARLSVFGHFLQLAEGTRVTAQVVTLVPLAYVSYCVYQSLMKMHILTITTDTPLSMKVSSPRLHPILRTISLHSKALMISIQHLHDEGPVVIVGWWPLSALQSTPHSY